MRVLEYITVQTTSPVIWLRVNVKMPKNPTNITKNEMAERKTGVSFVDD